MVFRSTITSNPFFKTISKESDMFNFEEELKKLPKEPGVYIMRDDRDVILDRKSVV